MPFSLGPEKRQRYVDMAKEYNEKASSLLWTTVPKLNMKYSKIFLLYLLFFNFVICLVWDTVVLSKLVLKGLS